MENKQNEVEEEILEMLEDFPEALEKWEKLSSSHKREYIKWLSEAKKEETRQSRKEKMIDFPKEYYYPKNDKIGTGIFCL